ncbi:MAG: 30S ribosomal protein S16 [Mycobacteriales bacterium]
MATKIKLMRLGKMRAPYYRVVVADSRTKRDGRAIETIGKYHPKEDPSFIEVDSERVQYWLGVGAQPTEAVAAILRVTGDWQRFRGEPAPPPMLTKAPKADKKLAFETAAHESIAAAEAERSAGRGGARRAADKAARPRSAPTADQMAAAAAESGQTLTDAREQAGDIPPDAASAPAAPDTLAPPAAPDLPDAPPPATAPDAPAAPPRREAAVDAEVAVDPAGHEAAE